MPTRSAAFGQRRAVGDKYLCPHLVCDHMSQRRLSEARRPVQQHVIDRLLTRPGGLDGDTKLADQRFLPDVLGKPQRPQRVVLSLFTLPT